MASIASEYLADMLEPEKFAAAIFGVTLTFTVLSANVVGLRTWLRLRAKKFGNDDYLMCTALVGLIILPSWCLKWRTGELMPSTARQPGAQRHSDARDVRRHRLARSETQLRAPDGGAEGAWQTPSWPHLLSIQLTAFAVPLPVADLLYH